ncbi:MAG: hypothetical protein ACRDTG_28495 [Pseudonocardiaceae bacterium]
MPRPGPRRQAIAIRLSAEGLAVVKDLAERETGGNLSEMCRKLLSEAVAARQTQPPSRKRANQ